MKTITQEILKEWLKYDHETGVFIWVKKPNRRIVINSIAGRITCYGYVAINVNGRPYIAHRLAWLYVHGHWPAQQIDHINGIRNDNRICNLRDVSANINQQNQRKPQKTNRIGLMGVSALRDRFKASIHLSGKTKYLGLFDTPHEAHDAYLKAKRQFHPGCVI